MKKYWITLFYILRWLVPFQPAQPTQQLVESNWFLRHSISSPLSVILLNLELALKAHNPDHLNRALDQAKYLQQVITPTAQSTFSVSSALHEVAVLIKSSYRNCAVLTHFSLVQNPQLLGSKFHFQEAILCLCRNAYQAYSDHTHPNLLILISASLQNRHLHISVTDGGKGMSFWEQRLATQPGFSLGESSENTGLGLAAVKNIAEHIYKGKMYITSSPRRGTTVKLVLPITDQITT
jgi:signal transduction histidine kinase